MESFENIKKLWKEAQSDDASFGHLDRESLDAYARGEMKTIKKIAGEYFWGSFVYHNIIYALLAYVIVKYGIYRGNTQLMLLSLAGILLYIPFTTIMMKKFKAMCRPKTDTGQNIRQFIKHRYELLAGFFRFKKRFDWIGIPVTGFIMVTIIFLLYVPGGVTENLLSAILLFAVVAAVLISFIYVENRKRFMDPLKKLELILKSMDELPDD